MVECWSRVPEARGSIPGEGSSDLSFTAQIFPALVV